MIPRGDKESADPEESPEVGPHRADRRATAEFLLGRAGGMEDWAKELNKMAGEAYSAHQDDKAQWFREVSILTAQRGERLRAEYQQYKRDYGIL